ncbi:Multiple sugar transport system permease protein OS=Streptomyces albaduncus OX=68172 GN=FHS32_005049 PE=3 SV=1 [Streptomyces griseoloalbus]
MTSADLRTRPARPTVSPLPAARRARRGVQRGRNLTLGASRTARSLALAALAVLAVVWLLPMAWAVFTAFKSEQDASDPVHWIWPQAGFTLDGFRTVIERGDLPLWMQRRLRLRGRHRRHGRRVGGRRLRLLPYGVPGAASCSRSPSRRSWCCRRMLIVPWFRQMLTLDLVDTYGGGDPAVPSPGSWCSS